MAKRGALEGGHRWAFARIGGVDQVLLRDGADIAHLPDLDRKLWGALAMPKRATGVLAETLNALDTDGDGRIRADEIIAAIRFCSANLASLDELVKPGESLQIGSVKPGPIAEAAAWALKLQGISGAQEISLKEASNGLAEFAAHRFNGDGVLSAQSAQDPGVAALVTDIVETGYGTLDLSGSQGAAGAGLAAFLADAGAWLAWRRRPEADAALLPLGEATAAAWTALESVRAKIDDHFLRSSLAEIAGASGGAAWGQEAKLASLLATGITRDSPELLDLPLAAPRDTLDLAGPVNPGWSQLLHSFAAVAAPLLGTGSRLDADRWDRVKATLAPYGDWLAAQPPGKIGSRGEARLTAILQGQDRVRLEELIAEDAEWAGKKDHLSDLVKLLLYRRDLFRILRNFANFTDFYIKRDAVFQAGVLYLDGRQCDLCMEVENPAAHAALSIMSGAYLVYCECSRPDGKRKSIAAVFTAGEAGNLFVGRNGVYYDREGHDWDARVSRLQVQPISIREAFFSPYRWLARTIEDLVAKRAAAAEAGSQAKLKSQAEGAVATVAGSKAEAKVEPPKKVDVGTVAAIGVALGSIGAMVTGILSAFVGMGVWLPVGLVSIFLLISGPSVILAYLKLRRRNLGPILDAEGWAVNGRLRINVPFGGTLTRLAVLPPGSERLLQDPFAEKKRPWALYLALLVLIALAAFWALGAVDPMLPEGLRLRQLLSR